MEFERRIQLISPDLIIDEKPNSDLILSILNEAQDRYVMMNYVGDDRWKLKPTHILEIQILLRVYW